MTETRMAVAIVPCEDMNVNAGFYRRLGFRLVSDFGTYRILSDGKLHLDLREAEAELPDSKSNPFGPYLYVDDVDALAAQVQELIIEKDGPNHKPWGMYEFAIGDPNGILVRVGTPSEPDANSGAKSK